MALVKLSVPDISCEHCERTVKTALGTVAGVQDVSVDIPAKTVRVQYDAGAVDVARMKDVLAEEDYPVASVEQAA
jgi:copper chaperone